MNKKILIINPNTYRTPPVIPIGPEYVVSSLRSAGWDAALLDLAFDEDPVASAVAAFREIKPLFAGISIRNIDSALYQNNVYFLPEIRNLVRALKDEGAVVVLGGAGFFAASVEILDYTGADYGVKGPGELAIRSIAETLASGAAPQRLTNGWKTGIDPFFCPERPVAGVDYKKYISSGGIVGFATQYGCTENCPYCMEATAPAVFRDAGAVVREIECLVNAGFDTFHLCDSEFNLDISRSVRFASALASAPFKIKWAVYMKPVPHSPELFELLKKSGAHVITLSVDTMTLSSEKGRYCFEDLRRIIQSCRDEGIRLAVDLLTGYPGESSDSTMKTIDFFSSVSPDTVGINSYIRIYPGTEIERLIRSRPDLFEKTTAPLSGDLLSPVFYSHLGEDELRKMTAGRPGFRIEGFDRNANYERLTD